MNHDTMAMHTQEMLQAASIQHQEALRRYARADDALDRERFWQHAEHWNNITLRLLALEATLFGLHPEEQGE